MSERPCAPHRTRGIGSAPGVPFGGRPALPRSDQSLGSSAKPDCKQFPAWSRITRCSLPGAGRRPRPTCWRCSAIDFVGRSRDHGADARHIQSLANQLARRDDLDVAGAEPGECRALAAWAIGDVRSRSLIRDFCSPNRQSACARKRSYASPSTCRPEFRASIVCMCAASAITRSSGSSGKFRIASAP